MKNVNFLLMEMKAFLGCLWKMNSQLKEVSTLTSERVGFTHKWSNCCRTVGV